MSFHKGQRVRTTSLGRERKIFGETRYPVFGEVTQTPKSTSYTLGVRPDGRKASARYHQSFWEDAKERC